jgi:4-diphosphocytidyl-2-C-methyl-D-erythritol kinase
MALVLVPAAEGLATGDVYKEADRIGSVRAHLDPGHLRHVASAPLAELARNLENDLEAAALSLRPELARTIDALEEEGALAARVTGSGPTVYGVFTSRTEAANAARIWSNALVTSLLPSPR